MQRKTSNLQSGTSAYDAMAKLAIIGDSSVGKTNILLKYVNSQVNMSHIATIGIDFKVKSVNINGYKLKLQIWDTAGQQRFRNLTGTVYQGAQAILLVYSVTDRKTFTNLIKWIQDVNNNAPSNVIIAIAGNKTDIQNQRVVSTQQGKNIAKSLNNCIFFQTSAKQNSNINELFDAIAKKIKDKISSQQSKKEINNNSPSKKPLGQNKNQKNNSNVTQQKTKKVQTVKLKKQTESKQDKKKKCC